MADSFETASVKLVTIIVPYHLGDTIANDLRTIGANGYTKSSVDGWGQHGERHRGLIGEPNIRFDTLVTEELARVILIQMDARSEVAAIIAYSRDAEAVPRRHFV